MESPFASASITSYPSASSLISVSSASSASSDSSSQSFDPSELKNTLAPFLKDRFKGDKEKAEIFVNKLVSFKYTGPNLINATEDDLTDNLGANGAHLYSFLKSINKEVRISVYPEGHEKEITEFTKDISKDAIEDRFETYLDKDIWKKQPTIIQITLDETKKLGVLCKG